MQNEREPTNEAMPRVIAIDWSGAMHGAERKIWLAEVRDSRVVRLECGRSRGAIEAQLIEDAARDPRAIIGLDFAFSMPAWFLREHGFASAHALWAHAASGGAEAWLAACEPPFWGRAGKRRPAPDPLRPQLRRCEDGIGAKPVFQVGGAGAVGTGSLRGMRMLHRMHESGFRIWPYDDPAWPLVVEIYPRALTGAVVKSRRDAREAYCAEHGARVPPEFLAAAHASDDAFDALFSALRMWERIDELRALPQARDDIERIEGAIWLPS
jgi:hypothetical protein